MVSADGVACPMRSRYATDRSGTDDCGDNSDEDQCPYHIPRRTITAAIVGATVCSILFVIALSCTCKLFRLRLMERQASFHLVEPRLFAAHNSSSSSVERQRIAPPSYNQTMGLADERDDSQAMIVDNLRLAGLSDLVALPTGHPRARSSRRGHRRRRRRHHSNGETQQC